MKRILSLILSAILLGFLIAPAGAFAAGNFTMELSADKTQVRPGDTVTISVKATSNPGFLLFAAAPKFDKTAFTQEGKVSYGSIGTGTKGINAVIDAGDKDSTATGLLFTFTIKVNDGAASGSYAIGLKGIPGETPDVINTAEENVPCTFNTVSVEIAGGQEGQAATPATTNAADPAENKTDTPETTTGEGSEPKLNVAVKAPEGELQKGTVKVVGENGTEVEVTEKDYSFENGQLKLNDAFLAKLDGGKYKLSFKVGDTDVEESFVVPATAENGGSPVLWILLSVAAVIVVAVAAFVIIKRKKSSGK